MTVGSRAPGAEPSGGGSSDTGSSNPDASHFPCPGCGAVLPYASARYPKRYCQSCLRAAVDAEGRALEFLNASMSSGFWWRRCGDATWHQETHDLLLCTIGGVAVVVCEARFGGIVAEPIPPDYAPPTRKPFGGTVRVADLRGR